METHAHSRTVVSVCAGLVEVGNGVVGVVLVLPPPDAEALHQVAPEHTREVAVCSVLEHLRKIGIGTTSDRQRAHNVHCWSVCLRPVVLRRNWGDRGTCLGRVVR